MKNIGKLVRNCSINRLCFKSELYRFLRSYRDAPHGSNSVSPARAMFRYNARFSRIPSTFEDIEPDSFTSIALAKDAESKSKMKNYSDKRNRAQAADFKIVEKVLIDTKKSFILNDKKITIFADEGYEITSIKGSMITATNSRHSITRNSSFFKRHTFNGDPPYLEQDYELLDFTSKDST